MNNTDYIPDWFIPADKPTTSPTGSFQPTNKNLQAKTKTNKKTPSFSLPRKPNPRYANGTVRNCGEHRRRTAGIC